MTNQLVEAAEAIPDLDEYAGLSTHEIAVAIQYAPEGSEELYRAIAAISARAPGRGHNRPPLAEALEDETRALRARTDELIELAETAIIPEGDDAAAAKVGDLIGLHKALIAEADETRLERNKPFRLAQKMINDHYGRITLALNLSLGGTTGVDGLVGILTAHDNKRRAQIEAERKAALAEQKERERVAAEAQRRADEAAAKGSGAAAQLDLLQARNEADRAAARAAAIRAVPIRSQLGTVTRKRDPKHQIKDPVKFACWLLEQPTYRGALLQALNTIAGHVRRDAGIEAVAQGLDIPGLKTWVEQGAANVRR